MGGQPTTLPSRSAATSPRRWQAWRRLSPARACDQVARGSIEGCYRGALMASSSARCDESDFSDQEDGGDMGGRVRRIYAARSIPVPGGARTDLKCVRHLVGGRLEEDFDVRARRHLGHDRATTRGKSSTQI